MSKQKDRPDRDEIATMMRTAFNVSPNSVFWQGIAEVLAAQIIALFPDSSDTRELDRPPLISRARAESAVPLEDCSGQKYEDGLREDIIRYVLYGAEIQRDMDWFKKGEHWIDAPNKRGDYWLSPFIEGKYISPRLISVIDYDRPDRRIEVQYDRLGETIPVKLFCEEYYPRAKWLFIPEPNWQALKDEK